MGEAAKRAGSRAITETDQDGSSEAHAINRGETQNRGGATGKVGTGQGTASEKSSLELDSIDNAAASPAALLLCFVQSASVK